LPNVESPTVRSYAGAVPRGVGRAVRPSCLGGYCAGGGRRLRVYVNGTLAQGDPTSRVLEPHQEILVTFGTAARLPRPSHPATASHPASYRRPRPRRGTTGAARDKDPQRRGMGVAPTLRNLHRVPPALARIGAWRAAPGPGVGLAGILFRLSGSASGG
jgi:hypothetical protein